MALHSTYPQAIWCHIGGECEIKSTCNINDFRNFRRPFGCVPHRSIAYKYDSLDDHPYTTTSNITRYCRVCDDDRVEARSHFNPSPPGQNGRHFTDDVFKCIFMNEKLRILIKILLKIVPKCLIDNNPTLDQTMACRRTGEAEGVGVGVGVAGGWWVVGGGWVKQSSKCSPVSWVIWKDLRHPVMTSHERHGVSSHRQHDYLLKLFRLTSKNTQKVCITGPLWGKPPVTGWIPLTKGPVMRKAFPLPWHHHFLGNLLWLSFIPR